MNPIGIFDSGYGGLTVFREIAAALPKHDFIYLGDNARAPYGNRSFETIYAYTLDAVKWLFDRGCHLVILACNTASAKALRTIQQKDLPAIAPKRRVLGVIRPVTEIIGACSRSRHIGIFATAGTVRSDSYSIEIAKFFPDLTVTLEACPLWVPIIESNEIDTPGADYFLQKHADRLLARDNLIDAIILGCTHYPLLMHRLRRFLPERVTLINQGSIVAASLVRYLQRHPELACRCSASGTVSFYTTDYPENFDSLATLFFGSKIVSARAEV